MAAVLVRLIAVTSALLVLPLALINWVRFERDVYISGRTSDVVFPSGDGYAIAALAGTVLLARLGRTAWPPLDALFPWVCIVCGLGITVIGGSVLFEDWAGERMLTLYAQFVLGITISLCGALMLGLRGRSAPLDERDVEEGEVRG